MQSNSENSPNTSKPIYKTNLTLDISTLESRTLDVLNAAFPQGVSIPIDIELLAEYHLGLQILTIPGLEKAFGVYGVFAKRSDGHFDLIIDENIMDGHPSRYRFTVGEEIAHYVLHRHHFATANTIADVCRVYTSLREHHEGIERNARWFSSALLVPSKQVKEAAARYYTKMVQAVGFGNPGAILSMLTRELAKEFGVSSETMKYRLLNYPCKVYDAARKAVADQHSSLFQTDPPPK